MNDRDLKEHWLQEKYIGYSIALISFLLVCLGSVAVWIMLEIKDEVKDLAHVVKENNKAMHERVNKIERTQLHGAVKIGEILKTHENKIEFNTHRIEKLEESLK